MKKHYETHVEDTDKLISVAGPVLDYKSWYEQYRKLMEEQAQRKYGLYTPTSEGDDDDFPSITGMIARYSALGLTNEQMAANPVWVDKTGNGHDLQMKNFAWKEGSGISDVYLGALVFDGVDDYGVCDNFPILTKEKGYTVVALRQWITYNPNTISAIATNASDQSFNGAFTFENYNKGAEQTISYGATQISLQYSKSPFSWQTTSKYNGVNIANRNKDATNSLVLGRSYPQRNDFANFAIWELVFLDHDATEEELNKIKDYFVKTYPWLFPDQAWTVVGKTNEDEDRATIANITGNGNNLVLSNFGFAEGSGYNEQGEYAGYLVTDGVDDRVQDSSFKLNKDWTLVGEWVFLNQKATNAGITKPFSFVVYNRTTGLSLFINTGTSGITIENVKSIKAICSDGRIYFDDWSKMLISKDQDITSSTSVLSIGFNGTAYTQMAFKNLGIYNNQLLSKDDCIKAYNYLQTLKSK